MHQPGLDTRVGPLGRGACCLSFLKLNPSCQNNIDEVTLESPKVNIASEKKDPCNHWNEIFHKLCWCPDPGADSHVNELSSPQQPSSPDAHASAFMAGYRVLAAE